MRFYYDLHIHSCLSPCGDDDMTPYNIVNMAKLNGLNVIAITDHNSSRNAPAVLKAADEIGLVAIAGMELTTREDVHILTLFPNVENALEFNDFVDSKRMRIENRTEIYGSQLIMNDRDEIIGEEKDLLITATDIGVYEAVKAVGAYGGAALPAHIDRDGNGLVAVLGSLEKDMGFRAVEFSLFAKREFIEKYAKEGYGVIRDSDAHRLEEISEAGGDNYIDTDVLTAQSVIAALSFGADIK